MTLDEARLMANVNARAQRLFEDGYRGRWTGPGTLAVSNGRADTYRVDVSAEICDCPFFRKGGHTCKHVLGWRILLKRQRSCRRLLALAPLLAWNDLDDRAA